VPGSHLPCSLTLGRILCGSSRVEVNGLRGTGWSEGWKGAGMAKTRLRGSGCDSRRRGMFGIGGRAFSSTDGIKGMFATVSTSLMSWRSSLRRHQGVVGFLDFTWHLAQDLAEVGAVVEKANRRPQILHVSRQRATSAATRLHLRHHARVQRSTCGVILLRHVRIGSPPHANVTLSAPIGPSNFTYTHLQQNSTRVTRSHSYHHASMPGRECLDRLKQIVASRRSHLANTG
jgi:hypothetical protein